MRLPQEMRGLPGISEHGGESHCRSMRCVMFCKQFFISLGCYWARYFSHKHEHPKASLVTVRQKPLCCQAQTSISPKSAEHHLV